MESKKLLAKPLIKEIYANLKEEIETFASSPKLVILQIGDNPASEFYVQNLLKKSQKVGIDAELKKFDTDITQDQFLSEIKKLNEDENVHGIMLQKPFPKGFDDDVITEFINPDKDVDGFHPTNLGKLMLGKDSFVPCTPQAVLEMLRFYKIKTEGKHIVVLGRSNIVGKPLANLLLRKDETGNATVTVCHSRTKDLKNITMQADILIAAIGRARFVKNDMIKQNAVVIDVGVNLITEDGKDKYVGDVDFDGCYEKALLITPVPKGVGSVTTSLLLKNVIKAYKLGLKK
jgi:methylenetetrahydrofolate dehydrogenase (NADP+)/methenyltetrahydrofolate cyclohydrolase